MNKFDPCVLIPLYNHPDKLAETLSAIDALGLPKIIVDDGSGADCKKVINDLVAGRDDIYLVEHDVNRGKGAAIKTGLRKALKMGMSHAVQVDADGQHNINDIPRFLQAAKNSPQCLVAGCPDYDSSVPKVRYYCRYLTHVWVWINTLSLAIVDSMCGFRVYPVQYSVNLLECESMGDRMEFDTEFMVRWFWRGWPLQQLSTKVVYPEGGISHFLAWRDNKLISWMHTRLFFGMVWRLPKLLGNKFKPGYS